MNHPDYVYMPLSDEQRKKRSDAAMIRIYGSLAKAKKARALKLKRLVVRRTKLVTELGRVRAMILQLKKVRT